MTEALRELLDFTSKVVNYYCIRQKGTGKPVAIKDGGNGSAYICEASLSDDFVFPNKEKADKALHLLNLENEYYVDTYSLQEHEAMKEQAAGGIG